MFMHLVGHHVENMAYFNACHEGCFFPSINCPVIEFWKQMSATVVDHPARAVASRVVGTSTQGWQQRGGRAQGRIMY